ncbi:hypothetical protein [Salinispora mooreana]|uniref:hypothetical protein n=1 Tax=Salinispora mooreana TaxID=999545 RepID=UPI000381C55E|nr:hypothetical protein [Salinispora mooreana]
MIFFDILVYLAVARIAVLLFEDAAWAARGKQSPRRQARARQQAAGGQADRASGSAGRAGVVAAADGYVAGLIEDATDRARARRRRAVARKRGSRAVDGVATDVDEAGRWYADCDICGWSSRPFRIEANAQGAGREHTRTEHPDRYTGQPAEAEEGQVDEAVVESEQPLGRPALRVIPGGAQDAQDTREVQGDPDPDEPSSVVHDDAHPYCLQPCGPTCTAPRPQPRFGWRCRVCGQGDSSFTSMPAAQAAGNRHTCPQPATEPVADDPHPDDEMEMVGAPATGAAGECAYCEPAREGVPERWCDNLTAGPDSPFCDAHETSGDDAGSVHHPTAVGAAGITEHLRELTVNLEATGPEEIRAAFTQAAEAAGERAEEVAGVAGVLTEAADRYEGLQMAVSTVGHLRDAAEAFAAAQAALNTAQEELQAALGDFNSKDGAVAEVVADAGGNVASKEVLVG